MFVIELDVLHLEAAAPLGLVPQTILERTARVLLSDEELYRFRVVKLRERYRRIARGRIRLLDAALPPVEAYAILMADANKRAGNHRLTAWVAGVVQAALNEGSTHAQRIRRGRRQTDGAFRP